MRCPALCALWVGKEKAMRRSGWQVKLENGPKLDVNRLARRRFLRSGAVTGPKFRRAFALAVKDALNTFDTTSNALLSG